MEALEKETMRKNILQNNDWKFIYGYREVDEVDDYENWSDCCPAN